MFRLDGIKRQFGARVLFEELSWVIPAGARLALVGPNGAGKTTLLRILSGREKPDAGSVQRPRDVTIGYLSQEVETLEQGSVLSVVLAGFEELARLEAEMERLELELGRARAEDAETRRLTERYGELRQRFEQLEGDRLEAQAKRILSGLGIDTAVFHEPIETLSGGWRMRVALARLLLGKPGLLLLDEPTNHLDLEAIGWLEGFLEAYEGATIVVSHDRYFLNRVAREIVELESGTLTEYHGNYDAYVTAKQARREARIQQAKQQAREIKKVERFIERFRYKNTKAKQVQSRIRSLGKVERVEVEQAARSVRFGFPPAPRAGDVIVKIDGLAKRFDDTVVYDGLDLLLRRGQRVALIGPNGAGKSTLLKLLAGRIAPDAGTILLGHNVRVQYYAQHQLDDLEPRSTLLDEMERAAPGHDRLALRKILGSFLFTGDDVDKRVGVLSGGEKARLALAKLLVRESNLLLLDEPTNHLDLRSREILEEALNEYAGAIVVISHDRYFINRVVTSIADVAGGEVFLLEGDYDEYAEWRRRRAAEQPNEPDAAPSPAGRRDERREVRRLEAEERNRRYRERQAAQARLEPIEREIEEIETRLRELERQQADPEVYRDPTRAAQVGRDRTRAEARLEQLYGEWERLAAGG